MKMGNRFLLTILNQSVMVQKYSSIKSLLLLFVLSLSISSILFPQSADSLVGHWELIKNARQWDVDLRFEKNMNFTVQRHLSAQYSYQLKGDTLISFLQNTYPDSELVVDTSIITVKNDTIVRTYTKSGETNSIHMIKDNTYHTPDYKKGDPLIGRWKWTYPSKDTAVETFNNDQTWNFYVIGKLNTGHYEVNKDTLTMIYNNKKNTKRVHTFWIQQDMMGIKDLKTKKEYLYKRDKQ